MKTSELQGAALDWAVAKCEGQTYQWQSGGQVFTYKPSMRWSQGGPIIEREKIETRLYYNDPPGQWCAEGQDGTFTHGPTPLIAAMRCYCASKLGDEVDVPEELA